MKCTLLCFYRYCLMDILTLNVEQLVQILKWLTSNAMNHLTFNKEVLRGFETWKRKYGRLDLFTLWTELSVECVNWLILSTKTRVALAEFNRFYPLHVGKRYNRSMLLLYMIDPVRLIHNNPLIVSGKLFDYHG